MTTDIDMSIAEDLRVPNEILYVPRMSERLIDLAAVRFEAQASASDIRESLRRNCLEAARKQVLAAWPPTVMWLFVCHSAWQPKNRISIHRRLWKSLEHSGLVLPSGERSGEVQIEKSEAVRFFGAVRVPMEEMERAYEALQAEPASFLVASVKIQPPVIDEHLVSIWQRHNLPDVVSWADLAGVICPGGRVLFRPFGFFDDVDVGVDLILESRGLGQLIEAA